jgi:hypothetical protein
MIVLVPKSSHVFAQPSGYLMHHLALGLPPEASDAQQAALVAADYAPHGRKHLVLASRKVDVGDPDGNEVKFICAEPSTFHDDSSSRCAGYTAPLDSQTTKMTY